ncbi:VWA domain-containing protein [Mycobacterium sp. NBC_00419]|uniref:VWA domain-containing protein n=1 Tax=Mycobacterium sp. NBC_00419 TaxID=2975989 RepID=UPI002E1CA791
MTVPVLGTFSLSGFQHGWFFLYGFIALATLGGYLAAQFAKRTSVLRFANFELLSRIAPRPPRRARHLPAALLVVALLTLTVALAGPTHDMRVPRNRAIVMLVIDVSESMAASDVAPSRLAAAKDAGKAFADELTPGINLGLVAFAGTASVLVQPTTNRALMKAAIDKLQTADRTATGEGILTALQAISTADNVLGGGDGPPPARIVLESDGKETVPPNPDDARGAFSAAQSAKEQGVPISSISFGTPDGAVDLDGQHIAVPVDDATLKQISEISGGEVFHAGSLPQLTSVYSTLQQQIGYQLIPGDASAAWAILASLLVAGSALAGVLVNSRIPA